MKDFRSRRRFSILVGVFLPATLAFAPADYPRDWGGGGGGYKLFLDATTKHGGQSSGSIQSTDGPGNFGTFTQWLRADRYRGKRLRLTGFLKIEGVGPGGAGLWMRVDGKEKTSIAFDNMEKRRPRGTSDWKPYEVVLDVPDEAEEIYFGCLLVGPGKAWVDDLRFEVVGKDVPTTQLDVTPDDRGKDQPPFKVTRTTPTNLDFEL